MDEMSLVSIILPTYNVEPYLEKCLFSVTRQTYKKIEVIIVIDGATDGSYEIAKRVAEKDQRVRVIWQNNAGSGPARNNGIDHAKGEYIIFVDPDDFVDSNMVQLLMETQAKENVDLILTGCKTFYENNKNDRTSIDFQYEVCRDRASARNRYLYYFSKDLLSAPTRKLYKASIIRDNSIRFPDLRRSQDIVFNYRYYDHVNSVCLSNIAFYHYRIDEKNYIYKLKKDYYQTLSIIYDEIITLCNKWGLDPNSKESTELCNYFMFSIISNIEANKHRGEEIDPILSNKTIRQIVSKSMPPRLDQKLFKIAIISKNYLLLNLLIYVKMIIKRR